MKPGFMKGKPVEEQRRELVNEYRALAHWYRTHGDPALAKDCEEVADQTAQLNMFEEQEAQKRKDAKVRDRNRQIKLF